MNRYEEDTAVPRGVATVNRPELAMGTSAVIEPVVAAVV